MQFYEVLYLTLKKGQQCSDSHGRLCKGRHVAINLPGFLW